MPKTRLRAFLCAFLSFVLVLFCLCATGCEAAERTPPILQASADAIDTALTAAIAGKATALEQTAAECEASGSLPDGVESTLGAAEYATALRANATALRGLTYRPYVLAIMDDLYARSYIGEYLPILSAVPDMVDALSKHVRLESLTDEETTTEALIACYHFVLDDIYAGYVDTDTATQEAEDPTGYVGVGISVTPRDDGYIDVISVTENSPAKEAGILAGDILVAVDGTDISTIDYNEVVNRVRGEAGSPVSLTFSRGGTEYTVPVVRRAVRNETVRYKMLASGDGKTGYVLISEFSAGTFTDFVAAIEALEAQGATEFVFDVRSNPGGALESVLGVLEYILPENETLPLIRIEYKDDTDSFFSVEEYLLSRGADEDMLATYAAAKNHEISARMAILCNEYTASAGELFTSCLADFGVAEVFGTSTYGKGLGQSSYRVTDYYAYEAQGVPYYTYFDMAYFMIPAFFYSPPVSENYHGVGVMPHHEIALSEEAAEHYIAAIPEEIDNQLQAAVAFLESDTPLTPPPTADENEPPSTGNAPPSEDTEKQEPSFFTTDLFLYTAFGVLTGLTVLLTVFLVMDRKRREKDGSGAERYPFDDHGNDN